MFQGFQRIKGAIDNRIAEEQARQKALGGAPVSRSPSAAQKSTSRTESPAPKPRRPRPKDDGTRGPDPSEFENNFAIEDEGEGSSISESSGALGVNPGPMADSDKSQEPTASGEGTGKMPEATDKAPVSTPIELPADVRTKLRKLEKLESRYQELLRSYRIAHARAVSIEPFEKALKEHTPLAGISDPEALVEYLTQLNLKGDMVMDEFKRVSADRDDYKKKFEEAEKANATAREELATAKSATNGATPVDGVVKVDAASMDTPAPSVKSPASSVMRIFSPKITAEPADSKDDSEEFFSYDEEVPKLQAEVKEKVAQLENMQTQVSNLKTDLITSKKEVFTLKASLHQASSELESMKKNVNQGEADHGRFESQVREIEMLNIKLQATKSQLNILEKELAKQKAESSERILSQEKDLKVHQDIHVKLMTSQVAYRKEAEKSRETLDAQIQKLQLSKAKDVKQIEELSGQIKLLNLQLEESAVHESIEPKIIDTLTAGAVTGAAKKKNKKKGRNVGNATTATTPPKDEPEEKLISESVPASPLATELEAEITRLTEEIANRDAQIKKLQSKRKTEADLREELENMQDNFISIGQEHVEAKERIKELQGEKKDLEEKIAALEADIKGHNTKAKDSEKVTNDFTSLTAEYASLKLKSAILQSDLGAAQQLATSRYRDLTELREVLQKAQPELKALRAENATLKATKDELNARTSDLKRLEARERDLKADITSFKKQAADSQSEIRTLTEKLTQETNARVRAEDQARIAQRDMRKSDAEKIQLSASFEKSSAELANVQEEAAKLRSKVRELEDQVSKLAAEAAALKEETELRGSQFNNAQGLLGSMRDQAGEMAMQLKEAHDASSSLEEELAEVQRLLSERTREGETMRRLLADVDDRADAKVREMRERMEAAIEERDRAEDEASTNGRRRAREVDELKSKIRDFEREIKRAIDEKEELVHSEKEWKRKRDELEGVAQHATKEATEIRDAMQELRDALDGSEKQARDAEKQRGDMRKLLDDANARYEKLSKELKILQVKQMASSSRSSIDSGSTMGGVNGTGPAKGSVDYVYLKTILLQFLEQRDKKRQADLVKTVLGQLLQFDKKDQEKWMKAIAAR